MVQQILRRLMIDFFLQKEDGGWSPSVFPWFNQSRNLDFAYFRTLPKMYYGKFWEKS